MLPFVEATETSLPLIYQIFWYSGTLVGVSLFVYIMLEWIAPGLKKEIKSFIHYTIPKGIEDYKQWKRH